MNRLFKSSVKEKQTILTDRLWQRQIRIIIQQLAFASTQCFLIVAVPGWHGLVLEDVLNVMHAISGQHPIGLVNHQEPDSGQVWTPLQLLCFKKGKNSDSPGGQINGPLSESSFLPDNDLLASTTEGPKLASRTSLPELRKNKDKERGRVITRS